MRIDLKGSPQLGCVCTKKCWGHVGGSHLTLEALTTGADGAPYDEPPYLAGGGA